MIINPQSYQPGGTAYLALLGNYGADAAATAARIAESGDGKALNAFLSDLKRGNTGRTFDTRGTLAVFADQITSDPLAAPIESANKQIGNVVWNLLKNPWVLIVIAGLVAWKFGLFKKK